LAGFDVASVAFGECPLADDVNGEIVPAEARTDVDEEHIDELTS
jgi:hypothetical protein